MIQLQPFTSEDFDRLIAWAPNAEMLMQFAGPVFTFPLTKQQLEKYLEDSNRLTYKVIYLPKQITIGHAEIYRSNETMAMLCRLLIGDLAYRGKGLGYQLVNKLLPVAFEDTAIEVVALNVFNWNTSAITCYQKAGFVINEGISRQTNINGASWTALNMQIEKVRWEQMQKL